MSGPQRIAIANQKGGVGKTTLTANLAAAWAQQGQRILAIDVDPQNNLSDALGKSLGDYPGSLRGVYLGEQEILTARLRDVGVPGLDVVCAGDRFDRVNITLATQVRREEFLARALEGQVDDYDRVLFDCPPDLGLLTVNALVAADGVLVPVDMQDRNAWKGTAALLRSMRELAESGIEVGVLAIVKTGANERLLAYKILEEVLPRFELPIAATEIPRAVAHDNAMIAGEPLILREPEHPAAVAYRRLADELEQFAPVGVA